MPSSTAHDVVVDASATTSGSIAAAATSLLDDACSLCDEEAAPAPRREIHALARLCADTFRLRSSLLAGIAWPERWGREPVREMRLLSQERSILRVIESRMIKLAWKFMRIQACGDCWLDC